MTEEEKKKMKDLEDALAAEKAGRVEDKTKYDAAIAEKDTLIDQKTRDAIGARKEYKKLSEMSETEKAEMSAKEIELQQRQEDHEKSVKKFEDDQKAFTQKEIDARRERAINKIAGSDPELRTKVSDSFKKIVGHDVAQTDEEIGAIAQSAFNMLGIPKVDPVRGAINGDGGQAPNGGTGGTNFAEEKGGIELAKAMGLPVEKPAEGAAK